VDDFQRRLWKAFPRENSVDTPALERFYKELDEEIMEECLRVAISKEKRFTPNSNPNNRYLYGLLRTQVRGKYGHSDVYKPKKKREL